MSEKNRAIMRLPAVQLAPAFVIGAILAYYCDIPLRAALLIVTAAIAILIFLPRHDFRIAGIGLFAGAALMSGFLTFIVQPIYSLNGLNAELVCKVVEAEPCGNETTRCTVTFMYGGRECRALMYLSESVGLGDEISAYVQLSSYDDSSYLFSQNIFLRAEQISAVEIRRADFSIDRAMSEYRMGLVKTLRSCIDGDAGALASAMLFGDKTGFSAELTRNIRTSGVTHLTVVSGLHFMLCITVILFSLRRVYPIIRASAALLLIPFVVIFFGDSPSVLRAAFMLIISQLSVLSSHRDILLNYICSSYFAIVLFSPNAALDCGLMMSFLGVFGAGILAPAFSHNVIRRFRLRNSVGKSAVRCIIVSLCATTCTAPVVIMLYGGISIVGVLATVLIMPFFTAAVMFGVIFALTGGILTALAVPIGLLMKPVAWVIDILGRLDGAWLTLDFFGAGFLAAAAAILLTLSAIAPRRFGNTPVVLSLACAVTLAVVGSSVNADRRCIAFVSDGRSGAAVICTGREASVLISGAGGGLDDEIADVLARYGIKYLRCIIAQECDYMGAISIKRLCGLYDNGICEVCIPAEFAEYAECKTAIISTDSINYIEIFGLTITSARVGSDAQADIVLYNGYKFSEPDTNAVLPIYVSSRQNILPENGVNISHRSYVFVP